MSLSSCWHTFFSSFVSFSTFFCRLVHSWEATTFAQQPSWPGHKASVNEVRSTLPLCNTTFLVLPQLYVYVLTHFLLLYSIFSRSLHIGDFSPYGPHYRLLWQRQADHTWRATSAVSSAHIMQGHVRIGCLAAVSSRSGSCCA